MARQDASEIVNTLESRLSETDRIARCESLASRARKRLEQLRKGFQRLIDERLLQRPGEHRFAIHEHEGIQGQLDRLVFETDTQIESLLTARRKRLGEPLTDESE